MWLYLLIFSVILLIYLTHSEGRKMSPTSLGVIMLALGLFVGLSDMMGGYDRYIYGELFDEVSGKIAYGNSVMSSYIFTLYKSEWGYGGFNVLMGYVTQNRYIYILTLTLIIYTLLFISIKKYTNNYAFAVLMFLGLWFFFTFTYLRQVTAAAIGWLAIEYAIDRKPIKFFTIVLLAYGFHNSAIILSPLYFVPQLKFNKNTVIGIMVVCLALGVSGLPGLIFEQFGGLSGTEERMAGLVAQDERGVGFRFEYLLESMVFLYFILSNYHMFDEKNKTQMVLLNMALIFCAVLLFFVRSENGGRLSWFYMMGIIAIMTFIATKEKKITGTTTALLVLSLGLFMRIAVGWGMLVYPYKTFLTDGHREGDREYEQYEYDHRYDTDKFYK